MARLRDAVAAVEAAGLGYHLGAAVERIALAGEEGGANGITARRLREAVWLIERHIALTETGDAAALRAIHERLDRNGEVIRGLRALSAAVDARAGAPELEDAGIGLPPARPGYGEDRQDAAEGAATAPPAATLGREVALMMVRWALVLAVIVVVVVVATFVASWR